MSSARLSIMLNGLPHGYCLANRGLCEGDPISSFHFAIMGEALSRMIIVTGEGNLISGFTVAPNLPTITHLLFPDDTIIFCMAEEA